MTSIPVSTETKFQIKNLYKVFGSDPEFALREVLDNHFSKTELLEKHNHTLALQNINLEAKNWRNNGDNGPIWIRQIYPYSACKSSYRTYIWRNYFEGKDILLRSADELRAIRREKMSMVFQNFGLLPHKTVTENAGLALEARGISRREKLQ